MKIIHSTKAVSILIISVIVFFAGGCFGDNSSPVDAFPQAKDNEVRHVIFLDNKDHGKEDNYKVELIPGKVVKTDGVNISRMGLRLESDNLKGWGYTYYRVVGKELVLSTMMAVPEGSESADTFVAGSSLMVRYNSRLPIVIYSPKGVDIHYRVWMAGDELEATKGI